MPAVLNSLLKKYAPGLHHHLKQGLAQSGLPVPKMLLGRLQLAHSRLLNLNLRLIDPHVLRWIAEGLRPGDTFFDVGAYQGWMSMVAARQTGCKGRVVAFEPSPLSIEYLKYHKRINRLSQMEIVGKAVTNRDAVGVPFFLAGNADSSVNSLFEGQKGLSLDKSAVEIETITLDSFSRRSGLIPDMIKVDVEGAEIWVCEGARGVLAHRHPALIIETHPLWLPEGQKIEDLFELLRTYGYRVVDSVINRYRGADFGDYLCVADCEGSFRNSQ